MKALLTIQHLSFSSLSASVCQQEPAVSSAAL